MSGTIDIRWMMLAAFIALLMPLGFALLASGFSRAQNVAHTMSMVFLLFVTGVLGYWICGFAFHMGGLGQAGLTHEAVLSVFGRNVGVIGLSGFFVDAARHGPAVLALFLVQAMLMLPAVLIPTGALAERWRFHSVSIFGCAMSMLVYPLTANWIWGEGWLSRLGAVHLGHGVVDFAGSLVIHVAGGAAALAGAVVIGPRMRKFTRDGRPLAIPGHNIPMALAGTLILMVGWFGLVTLSGWAGVDGRGVVVATNTLLASTAGILSATVYMWWLFGAPDPSIISNGCLAGLVAISGCCAFVNSVAAVVIGLIGGLVVVASVFFVERTLRIDDPVGAISTHGTCGVWGALAVGLFADGTYGERWNHVPGAVKGLLYGDGGQLAAQAVGVVACGLWTFAAVFALFKILDVTIGNRVRPETELEGLDVAEMGTVAYPDFSLAPRGHEPTSFLVDRQK